YTGHISPYYIGELGVEGTLLNHSERKLVLNRIIESLKAAGEAGLKTVLCAATPTEAANVLDSGVKVSAVAIEPPELIGTGRAVSRYKPELIEEAAQVIKGYKVPLLCGAGIVTGEDVKKAGELGSQGILVASGVVKAPIPKQVLQDFAANL
nr:triose-phosphate isomerase [Nitrososphaeria archaeon]NIQ33327.1 triose-phosphate isomerase [Nitrososphaeria archaeon]